MGLKVAIVGLWTETHGLAHWDDPSWEKWGLAWDTEAFSMDRVFEMHLPREWKDNGISDYVERLSMMPRLYLQEPHPELPEAQVYPLAEVAKTTGDYFSSSIAYLMALAIHEGAEEIGLFGVAMEGHDDRREGEAGEQGERREALERIQAASGDLEQRIAELEAALAKRPA